MGFGSVEVSVEVSAEACLHQLFVVNDLPYSSGLMVARHLATPTCKSAFLVAIAPSAKLGFQGEMQNPG